MRPTARVTNPALALALLACLTALPLPTTLRAESAPAAGAQSPPAQKKPALAILSEALNAWADLVEPADATAAPRAVTGGVRFVKANGLPKQVADADVQFAVQAPDRLKVAARVGDTQYRVGRDGQQLWAATRRTDGTPGLAVVGKSGVPRFKAFPDELDDTVLEPLALPVSRLQLSLVPLMVRATSLPAEEVAGQRCHVLSLALLPATAQLLGVDDDAWHATLWVRESDLLPSQIDVTDGKQIDARIQFGDLRAASPSPEMKWSLDAAPNEPVQTVALAHLKRFHEVAPKGLRQEIPVLGPAAGRRETVATSADGLGRLERHDGTRVLFLAGTPEQMGRQHGELLKNEIRDVMDRILYGIGVGSSFGTGRWFFGEIEDAQARLEKFTDPRVLREMDALADAVGVHRQEARLSNFFPELFHCSGFAIMGKASGDGHLYHGRVLDYLKGVGLEQNAVLIVHRPTDANAWVNASYAGFVGSVTAMNEKGIAIGEMGGGGYGAWDGKPMAQLLREVMERANTLDEAVEIMRRGPRTCEYYYVISSGKEMRAVGIAATPTRFETIDPGQAHPQLKRPVDDAVLLSAGDRYEELVNRVQGGYGKFGAEKALELMTRPVCMTSNIQSVLFVPDTLDLYVANADSKNVASHTRFTKYNLRELLDGRGTAAASAK